MSRELVMGEAMRQKKRERKEHVEVGMAPSQSPHASKPLPAVPFHQTPAPETPILAEHKRKKRKDQQVAAPAPVQIPTLEEEEEEEAMMARNNKDRVRKKHEEQMPSSPSPSAAAETPILEQEAKMTKKLNRRKERDLSGQSPLPFDPRQTHGVQLQGTKDPTEQEQEEATDGPKGKSIKTSNGKKPRICVPSNRELIKARTESRKQQTLPEGFVAAMTVAPSPNSDSNCTAQNSNYSSPFGAFFDQFLYKPVRQDRNRLLPTTVDRLARLPSRGYPSFEPSQLIANKISKASKDNTSVASKTKQQKEADAPKGNTVKKSNCKKPRVLSDLELIKMRRMELRKQQVLPESSVAAMSVAPSPNCTEQNPNHSSPFGAFFDQFLYKPVHQDRNRLLPTTLDRLARLPPRGYPSGSSSASGSEAKVNVKEKKNLVKKMRTKKQMKPPLLFTKAEKRSDKYRRLPLDQLVPPPFSPHMLLQEEFASDPWKVIVICVLLNKTQGKQVSKKVKEFFEHYPDPQSAFNADPEKMEEYLTPLGLQRVKTSRIQKFSKAYVEKEWTYITELCGVGKYAADAYAIFCAGRATEVVPEDHKLVDYWKYVCFELPMIQEAAGVSAE